MANHDLAKYNEDVNDERRYCRYNISTARHTTCVCPFLRQLRVTTDLQLAKAQPHTWFTTFNVESHL